MAMNMSLNVNSYRRQQHDSTLSPSERWKTTSETELKRVAEQLVGTYDMKGMKDRMTQRKLNNTKTSINFGNEKMKRIKDMKAELTTTNFKLGDEVGQYDTVNRLAMTDTGLGGSAKVAINVHLKDAVKKSSIHFGNEPVDYKSVAQDSMQYKGSVGNFTTLKDEVKQMTNTLRKHNFSFGDEKVNYQSDYAAGYGDVDASSYKKSDESKASMRFIIDDSRSCHFSLGNDKVNYISNTQMALSSIDGRGVGDNLANIQGAKAIKTALQKTSIVIGDDEKYY